MTTMGSARLQKSLFLPAMVALKCHPALKGLKKRQTEKGKAKMAIIGAAMRKVIHIIYGVMTINMPFDEHIAINA